MENYKGFGVEIEFLEELYFFIFKDRGERVLKGGNLVLRGSCFEERFFDFLSFFVFSISRVFRGGSCSWCILEFMLIDVIWVRFVGGEKNLLFNIRVEKRKNILRE